MECIANEYMVFVIGIVSMIETKNETCVKLGWFDALLIHMVYSHAFTTTVCKVHVTSQNHQCTNDTHLKSFLSKESNV